LFRAKDIDVDGRLEDGQAGGSMPGRSGKRQDIPLPGARPKNCVVAIEAAQDRNRD
jgi:hypothetical protein